MSLLDTASLIVTPNGYKEGKLYSVIPSDGSGDMSVTRATTATRVNSAGLVELVPYNLVQYSEDFSNAVWNKIGVSVTANSVTAPNGTLTADTLVFGAGSNEIVQSVDNMSVGQEYTLSIYLRVASGTATMYWGNVDYTTPAITVTTEWQRFTVTQQAAATTRYPKLVSSSAVTIYAWGTQLVEGSTAKDYQKTETRLNIPRLDYSNGTCPSLLVEPQRTNVLNYSEDFANATWTKAFGSLTSNAITSPSGTLTADKFIEDTTNVEHYLEQSFTSIASTTYAFSLYAKAAERSRIVIQLLSVSSPFENVYIEANLVSGTLVVQQAYNGATFVGATIEELPNGWYRITGAGSIGAKTNMRMRIYIANDLGQITYLGNGTSGLYVWGAQLEAGSYATSYIPTTSASVTRNADVISKTGISSLIGQIEGTIFYEFSVPIVQDITRVLSVSGSSVDNRINISTYSDSIFVRVDVGGSNQVNTSAVISVTNMNRIALRYKANDFALYVNGVNVITDTSGITFPASTLDRISNLQPDGTNPFNGNIKAIALWETALSNTQLAQLTSI
jgi:hypothetical protein